MQCKASEENFVTPFDSMMIQSKGLFQTIRWSGVVGFVRVNNQYGQHGCSSPSAGSCASSPSSPAASPPPSHPRCCLPRRRAGFFPSSHQPTKNNRQRADSVPTAARQGQKGLSMCQNIFNSCKMEKMNGIPAANCTRLRVAFLRSHIFRRWYNINFLVSTYHSCIPIYASNAHSPLHVLHCS